MSEYVSQIIAGGVTFNIARRPNDSHEWAIVAGYVAPIQSWVMPAETAAAILAVIGSGQGTDREVELVFGDPDSPKTFKRIYVIGSVPADNPQRRKLLMADVRWYLTRMVFVIDVNVRRRLGDKRLIGPTLTGAGGSDTSVLADSVAYANWSINGTSAHTWKTQKDQVLNNLTAPKHGRPAIEWTTDLLSLSLDAQVVQEMNADGDGSAGLAYAIESLPGAGIYPDKDGVLHVFDATPGAERTLAGQLPKVLKNHGDLQLVDLSGIRPSLWRIYVDYALEVRFDFNPPTTTNNPFLTAALQITKLENVLQVTDQSLSIPEGAWGPARVVGQGTWITLDEAFAAWGGKTYGPIVLPQLTDDIVADHWFGDALQRYCVGGGITTQDPIWTMRVQELMRCYRTYFRVNSTFWDKVRHFWNVRAAVWDPVTGTRAPSPVYSNFNVTPLDNFVASSIKTCGLDVTTSYPTSGLLADGQPSGFHVFIEDEELMVIGIDRSITRFPGHARIAPSPVIAGADVTAGPGLNEAVLQKLQRKADWHLSIVMTCSPAAPNDMRRLYEIQVELADAIKSLGGLANTPAAHAPDQEIRTHMAEARCAWLDSDTNPAATVTTFGGPDAGAIGPQDPVRSITPINLNQELIPLAQAIAATDLVSKLDHFEGTMAVPMSDRLVPIGSISQIVHKVTNNRAVSVIHAGGPSPHFDATDFLRGSARSYLLKQIQKER